jgi:hypothetical protein
LEKQAKFYKSIFVHHVDSQLQIQTQADMPPGSNNRVVVGNLSASLELWAERTQRLGQIPKIACQRL